MFIAMDQGIMLYSIQFYITHATERKRDSKLHEIFRA